ncbi:sigma factor-like helix-turn-helix DNA-binding protein [uncultured Alistipes sp.]|uniref:sigma factor-like helix-turn-helix DNA-binding protein n=1 Tax=uncultured Alistipes sp. TaxID=538949 RepID=UPI002804EDC4|nr:sigma factor-like helix-turn-helix DNA-binding protein [uncultured Alistipes sp.]
MTRRVFLLSRQEGRTYKEIADELGITLSRVNFEIRRALELLREALKDYLPATLIFWMFTNRF